MNGGIDTIDLAVAVGSIAQHLVQHPAHIWEQPTPGGDISLPFHPLQGRCFLCGLQTPVRPPSAILLLPNLPTGRWEVASRVWRREQGLLQNIPFWEGTGGGQSIKA